MDGVLGIESNGLTVGRNGFLPLFIPCQSAGEALPGPGILGIGRDG